MMTAAGTLLRRLLLNGTGVFTQDDSWSDGDKQRRWTGTPAGDGPGAVSHSPPPSPLVDTSFNAAAAATTTAAAKNIFNQSLVNIGRWLEAGNGTLGSIYETANGGGNSGVHAAVEATTPTGATGIGVSAVAVTRTAAADLATAAVTSLLQQQERVSIPYDHDIYAQMFRDNFSDNSTANATSSYDVAMPAYWALLLSIIPVLTVFGNVLVVLSVYCERSLRTPTNYFIVSLAVADIMVAVLVMPLAVYTEVYHSVWLLGDGLCDTWVAFDVMCCTASILNLMAISIDRFIAVTQPISYAKHKNSKRHYIVIIFVWSVSVAISAPIALGMNYTERRTPELCIFYNSDFLIYSSMGSFYIPCVVMVLLYWRIFRVIRERSRRKKARSKKAKASSSAAPALPNAFAAIAANRHPATTRTTSDASATDNNSTKELLPTSASRSPNLPLTNTTIAEETSFTNYNAKLTLTDTEDGGSVNDSNSGAAMGGASTYAQEHSSRASDSESHIDGSGVHLTPNKTQYSAPNTVVVDLQYSLAASPAPRNNANSAFKKNGVKAALPATAHARRAAPAHHNVAKSVTKFNFRLRHSKKKTDRSAKKRERKATKTLAIVLGVFLFCWVPFFTINIINAICIRYDMFTRPVCNIDDMLFSFFVWLGYINSFLNPVIYTIFNFDFRRAFKKLLTGKCHGR